MMDESAMHEAITYTVNRLVPRFRDYGIDPADLWQEIAAYAYTPKGRADIARWSVTDEKHRVYLAMFGVGRRFAEQQKAAVLGYHFEDLAWYSPESLVDLIPAASDPTFDASQPIDYTEGKSSGIASQGGTMLAMVMDVRRALDACPAAAYDVHHCPEDSDEYRQALVDLAEFLGGDYPEAPGRGRRQVLSNSAAISLLAREG